MRWTWMAALGVVAACGGAPAGDDKDTIDTQEDTDVATVESDEPVLGVSLTVRSSYETDPLVSTPARLGRYVVVTARVVNGSGSRQLTAPPTFLVETNQGLEYFGDPVPTTLTAEPCPSEALLADGATIRCTLAFDIPDDEVPVALTYTFTGPGGAPAEVRTPFSSEPCTRCGSVCTDLDTDPSHCGSCFMNLPDDASCVAGDPVCDNTNRTWCDDTCVNTNNSREHCGDCNMPISDRETCAQGVPQCTLFYPTRCDGDCTNVNSDDDHCGACNSPAPNNTQCVGGEPACPNADLPTLCTDVCVDLDVNPDHCGTCGRACGTGMECIGGTCGEQIRVTNRVTCNSVCGDIGYVCAYGEARYAALGNSQVYEMACNETPLANEPVPGGWSGTFRHLTCDCFPP